jgi:glutaconate CoA-transferase subunit A
MPVAGHVGSDYERLRPDFRVIANPWEPAQRVLLVPAIRCDVALLHAIAATADGTLLLDSMEDDALLAQASRMVIASTERLTTLDGLRQAGEGVILPGIHVTAVVELPGGAHPTMVRGVHPLDAGHLAAYVAAAATDDAFRAYLERYVTGPAPRG